MRAERGEVDMAEFLCHGVCKPPVQTDQVYLFDRDDWRTGLPGLDEDVQLPQTIVRHFDAAWHERRGCNHHRSRSAAIAYSGATRCYCQWSHAQCG